MPISLFDPRVMLGLLLFLIAWSGIGGYMAYNRGSDDNEAVHIAQDLAATQKVLGGFVGEVQTLNGIAADFNAANRDLSTKIGLISRDFHNATRANPLPVDCKPDPFRVQSLSAAISAANTAAGRGAVPAVPPAN